MWEEGCGGCLGEDVEKRRCSIRGYVEGGCEEVKGVVEEGVREGKGVVEEGVGKEKGVVDKGVWGEMWWRRVWREMWWRRVWGRVHRQTYICKYLANLRLCRPQVIIMETKNLRLSLHSSEKAPVKVMETSWFSSERCGRREREHVCTHTPHQQLHITHLGKHYYYSYYYHKQWKKEDA